MTNAVKHFKYVVRGKHRIHVTPKVTEIRACRPWLEAGIRQIEPTTVVALGAAAAQTLLPTANGATANWPLLSTISKSSWIRWIRLRRLHLRRL